MTGRLTSTRMSKAHGLVTPYLVKESTTIHVGYLVMLDADGLLRTAAALASNKGCVGVSNQMVTSDANKLINGVPGHPAMLEAQEGIYYFGGGTGITQATVGSLVYTSDGNEVHAAQAANEPIAGLLREIVTRQVNGNPPATWYVVDVRASLGWNS